MCKMQNENRGFQCEVTLSDWSLIKKYYNPTRHARGITLEPSANIPLTKEVKAGSNTQLRLNYLKALQIE